MLMSGVILVTQPAFLFPATTVSELLMSSNQTLQNITNITNISEVTQVFGMEVSNITIGVGCAILASMCNSINGIATNQLKDKGQLISKCPFGVFKSSKKPTKFFFQDFCPSL